MEIDYQGKHISTHVQLCQSYSTPIYLLIESYGEGYYAFFLHYHPNRDVTEACSNIRQKGISPYLSASST